jgi:hypothetical protein
MKQLIFILFLFIFFSCEKTELPDSSKNYILINDLTPPSGSIINKPTEINATIIYNIAENELEQQGFEMTAWHCFVTEGTADYWSGNRMAWTINKRYDSRKYALEVFDAPPSDGKTYKMKYKYSISRLSTDGHKYILIESDPVFYTINGKF